MGVKGSAGDVTVTVTASPEEDITITDADGLIGAGFVGSDLEGSLTVKSTDAGSRAFEIEGECLAVGGYATIMIENKDLDVVVRGAILCDQRPVVHPTDRGAYSDAFTVTSYDDWDAYTLTDAGVKEYYVTDGFLVTDANGVLHQVTIGGTERGWLHRDEPVVDTYQLGISPIEYLTQRNDPEMGQYTVEVLVGEPNVQLTVTTEDDSPAYIRFLDSEMRPFGTDVDEVPMWRGADVVGLDSQGRLELNRRESLSAAQALAFDQYRWTVPGNPEQNAYLTGIEGTYNQGAFRFFNPCPADKGVGHHFYVQVYESYGKYLQTTEKVTCVTRPPIGPWELSVTTHSDRPGIAVLSWRAVIGAVAHHVFAIDSRTSVQVPGSYQRVPTADGTSATITGLRENMEYTFGVIAEHGDGTYSEAYYITQSFSWE